MSHSFFHLAVCFAATIGQVARAENITPPSEPMSIEELVTTTVALNPELRFYEAEIVAAKADRHSAGLLSNPVLSSDVGPMRTRDRDGNLAGEGVAWSVSVMQAFDWPCLLYTSPSPRDRTRSRMPSSA